MYIFDYLTPSELVAYEQAKTTIDMMEELASLRAENLSLKHKLNDKDDFIDGMYKQSIGQMGSLLSIMVNKADI